jgi:ABC-type uncharacterized transport system ATPase subunit
MIAGTERTTAGAMTDAIAISVGGTGPVSPDGLDLTVANGEVHGSANGAGKTTTLRILLGLLRRRRRGAATERSVGRRH